MLSRRVDVAIILACSGAFVALTLWTVLEGYLPGEQELLKWIVTHRVAYLDQPLLAVSALGSTNLILPLWFGLMFILIILRNWSVLLRIAPIPLSYLLIAAIKMAIGRAPPTPPTFSRINDLPLGYWFEGLFRQQIQTVLPSGIPVPTAQPVTGQWITQVMENGYVSGHALMALVFYGTAAWLIWQNVHFAPLRWLGALLLSVLALLVGLVRLYMGAHFPSDVLGAWLLGFVIVLLLNRLPEVVARGAARNPR